MESKKTILIIGTSTGIGEATVKLLSTKGFHVIATTRDPSKAEHLAKLENVTVIKLDILDYESVKTTCAQLMKDYNIDICFCNAGIGMASPVEKESMELIKKVFELNFFSTINLLQQFIPYFKEKKKGMFMVTSSIAGIQAIILQSVYGSSKRAMDAFLESLYYEMKPYNVPVKIIVPAYTKTPFKAIFNEVGEYKPAYKRQNLYLTDDFKYAAKPEETADCILEALTDGKDQIYYGADLQARKLMDKYNQMNIEDFKVFYSKKLYPEGAIESKPENK